jgi:hypothetical protein
MTLVYPPVGDLSAQVAGFSPVNAIFDVFRPISQLEGIDFSPVTRFCPEKIFGSYEKF